MTFGKTLFGRATLDHFKGRTDLWRAERRSHLVRTTFVRLRAKSCCQQSISRSASPFPSNRSRSKSAPTRRWPISSSATGRRQKSAENLATRRRRRRLPDPRSPDLRKFRWRRRREVLPWVPGWERRFRTCARCWASRRARCIPSCSSRGSWYTSECSTRRETPWWWHSAEINKPKFIIWKKR